MTNLLRFILIFTGCLIGTLSASSEVVLPSEDQVSHFLEEEPEGGCFRGKSTAYYCVTVVEPDSIGFLIDGGNWYLQQDLEYNIRVRLLDLTGNDVFIPPNAVFSTKFNSDHLKIMHSSSNGTYFHVRAVKAGTTTIESTFVELVDLSKQSKKFSIPIVGTQRVVISPPIQVTPNELIYPLDGKIYEANFNVTGGTGTYVWSSENRQVANVLENGRLRTSGALGKTVIRVEDYHNPLHYDLAKVVVMKPFGVRISGAHVIELTGKLPLGMVVYDDEGQEYQLNEPLVLNLNLELRTKKLKFEKKKFLDFVARDISIGGSSLTVTAVESDRK